MVRGQKHAICLALSLPPSGTCEVKVSASQVGDVTKIVVRIQVIQASEIGAWAETTAMRRAVRIGAKAAVVKKCIFFWRGEFINEAVCFWEEKERVFIL